MLLKQSSGIHVIYPLKEKLNKMSTNAPVKNIFFQTIAKTTNLYCPS